MVPVVALKVIQLADAVAVNVCAEPSLADKYRLCAPGFAEPPVYWRLIDPPLLVCATSTGTPLAVIWMFTVTCTEVV